MQEVRRVGIPRFVCYSREEPPFFSKQLTKGQYSAMLNGELVVVDLYTHRVFNGSSTPTDVVTLDLHESSEVISPTQLAEVVGRIATQEAAIPAAVQTADRQEHPLDSQEKSDKVQLSEGQEPLGSKSL